MSSKNDPKPYENDPKIDGDVILWRRIPPLAEPLKRDEKGNLEPPSSGRFRDKIDQLSVFVKELTSENEALKGHPGFGLVEIRAGDVRVILGAGAVICPDPDDDPPDPAHKIICFKVTKSQSRMLAGKCKWLREPDVIADRIQVTRPTTAPFRRRGLTRTCARGRAGRSLPEHSLAGRRLDAG